MEQQNNLNEGWEEVSDSNFWMPSVEGESVEGIIIAIDQDDYGRKVTIESNKKPIVLPSHKVLQSRLASCKMGDTIKVIFEKKELPKIKGHNPTFIYKVLIKR